MKFHSQVHWTDVDEEGQIAPRSKLIEEQVELRRHQKTLKACDLPEGFRLMTPEPKQFWMGQQLVWGFRLGWGRLDRKGNELPAEFFYVARYEQRIAAERQMRWAIEDFTRELEANGVRVGDVREFVPLRQSTKLLNVRTPVLDYLRRAS